MMRIGYSLLRLSQAGVVGLASATVGTPAIDSRVSWKRTAFNFSSAPSKASLLAPSSFSQSSLPISTYRAISTTIPSFSNITGFAPAFPESVTSGALEKWVKKIGDHVTEGELVALVETDKTSMEVRSPNSGTITEQLVKPGDQ